MIRLLLDADACLCLRKISLLSALAEHPLIELISTRYVARRELNSIQAEIHDLEKQGLMVVEEIQARTPAWRKFVDFYKSGVDKGEAELIAWATIQPQADQPFFVSLDKKARWFALKQKVGAGDVMDLAVLLVKEKALEKSVLAAHLSLCATIRCQHGCPSADFKTFDQAFDVRWR